MPGKSAETGVLVFAKAPIAGQVKTRLLPCLSEQQACELQRRLIDHTLQTTRASALPVELWCGQLHPELLSRGEHYAVRCFLQRGADLGERMADAVNSALGRYRRVLLIGCDCPGIDSDYLLAGARALEDHDVVLGPAADGGYVMIGLGAPQAEMFTDVAWGSDRVLATTRRRMKAANLAWLELDVLNDIDRPEDLAFARSQWPELFAGF